MATNAKICLVIGDPVAQSLSPAMHNAAYKALGIDTEYTFSAQKVTPEELADFINEARTGVHAMAVTIPHKETIIPHLDILDGMARVIGAVNTVFSVKGKLIGYNTDCSGAIESLKKHTSLVDKKVVVLGSGGSSRAIAYGLLAEKSKVNICSRNNERAKELAEDFGCEFAEWNKRNDSASEADIIINTTPIGKDGKELPIDESVISKGQVVFDINYSLNGTSVLNAAREKNAIAIDGLEMLLRQGMLQFEIYTGLKAPEEAMRNALQNKSSYAGTI
ncbi:MAG TPA: shikimate dehydrogenase [Bacteroidia bacterium]|jgi:shikimate dehydrogenase|nr:shikimate dehydrogenase [Bacteroidia bacterium]